MTPSIQLLKDTKLGEKCIIVGGGQSVNQIDWNYISIDIIAVNYCFIDAHIEYYFHTDKEVGEWYEYIETDTPVLSYASNECAHTTHRWNYQDFVAGTHTPYYALCFALMCGYDEIYLTGLDYYGELDALHYYDKVGAWTQYANLHMWGKYFEWKRMLDDKRKEYFEEQKGRYRQRGFAPTTSRLSWLRDFESVNATNVYNCSKFSELKKYEYRLPY